MNFPMRYSALPRVSSCFPVFFPSSLINDAVDEAQLNIKAPRPLIYFGVMAAVATSIQGLYDVRKPNGQVVPVSLMQLAVADSGERKSTAENIFFGGIREFQEEKNQEYQSALDEWAVRLKIWNTKNKEILKSIGKLSRAGACADAEEQRLMDHERVKPARPKQFKILYEDSTPEALFAGLHQNLSTAGLVSSEGGGVLSGRAFNDLSKQNSIWSGDSITVDRKTAESYVLNGARLSVSMMVQESAFKDYILRNGEKSRGSGLWARFLICFPRSTQGTRFIESGTMSWEFRNRFTLRIRGFLEKNEVLLNDKTFNRQIVQFSPEACERWLHVYNEIEAEICLDGRFHSFGDHASKLADNIARVAALLHVFEGYDGDISVGTLEFSIRLCFWCSDEFRFIFQLPKPEPLEVMDAADLDGWLWRYRDNGATWMEKNFIRQRGPNKLRDKGRLDRALSELYLQGKINFFFEGKKEFVDLDPRR